MIKKKKLFYLTCFSYLLTIVLDLLFTFIASPDLSMEGNPLYLTLSFGWQGLIILNAITFVAYVLMSYYAFIKYQSPVTDETNMKRYLAKINYGDPEKYVPMLWKLPKHWGPQIACLCWSVVCVLPICRMIVVVEWILIGFGIRNDITRAFFTVVSWFPLGRIDMFLAVLGAWFLSFVWIQKEFKANLKEIENRKATQES